MKTLGRENGDHVYKITLRFASLLPPTHWRVATSQSFYAPIILR